MRGLSFAAKTVVASFIYLSLDGPIVYILSYPNITKKRKSLSYTTFKQKVIVFFGSLFFQISDS